ncbi:MAG: phosphotransferase [Candidatus Binatia bacterium]|nr:phosphotransferase [Candidatus Binatia bacterium]
MKEHRLDLLEQAVRSTFGSYTQIDQRHPLAGDASTRSYERLRLSGPEAPPTAVVMWLADRGVSISSDELAMLPETLTELPYVNVYRFLCRVGVDVPLLYADWSHEGLLLLEDVGDRTLWHAVSETSEEDRITAYFQAAIDQLLLLQIKGTAQRTADCIAFQQEFDARLYLWECHHFLEWGLDRQERTLSPSERQSLETEFEEIASRLDAQPRYLAHRDFHSWNLFVQPEQRLRVIDFQDALLATPAYDLATLLGDRDTPTVLTSERERRLIDYYLTQWHAHGGPPLDPTHFTQTYYLCALQKALKVVGRFHYLAEAKRKPQYLRYIPGTLRQIRRLLPRFPEFPTLARAVHVHFPH